MFSRLIRKPIQDYNDYFALDASITNMLFKWEWKGRTDDFEDMLEKVIVYLEKRISDLKAKDDDTVDTIDEMALLSKQLEKNKLGHSQFNKWVLEEVEHYKKNRGDGKKGKCGFNYGLGSKHAAGMLEREKRHMDEQMTSIRWPDGGEMGELKQYKVISRGYFLMGRKNGVFIEDNESKMLRMSGQNERYTIVDAHCVFEAVDMLREIWIGMSKEEGVTEPWHDFCLEDVEEAKPCKFRCKIVRRSGRDEYCCGEPEVEYEERDGSIVGVYSCAGCRIEDFDGPEDSCPYTDNRKKRWMPKPGHQIAVYDENELGGKGDAKQKLPMKGMA